jgi:hypothetical protein
MRVTALCLIMFLSFSVIATGGETDGLKGVLMMNRHGAELAADDGRTYQISGMSYDFLNRNAGKRVMLVNSRIVVLPSRTIRADYTTPEVIVTAPRSSDEEKSAGTKAAESASLVVPPLIPPISF